MSEPTASDLAADVAVRQSEAAEAALADTQYQLTEERQWRERAGQLERKLADTRRALEEIEELCTHWKLHDATDPDEHERWRKAAIARAELIGEHARRALAAGAELRSPEDKP